MNAFTTCGAIVAIASCSISTTAHGQCSASKHQEPAARMMPAAMSGQEDIVETAVSNGNFKTLAAALGAAGLVETLQSDGPFTVFAPTDEAFAKLPAGTVNSLLKPGNKQQLIDILTYHVVPGEVKAANVIRLDNATTVNGQRVDIALANGAVTIDNATVTATDISCSNGVIHVIDTVILPSTSNIVETAQSAGGFSTLLAAAQAAGLADLLQSEGPFTVFAPTDEAFAKLPAGTVDSLLKPENRARLADILKYHVIPGRIYATDAIVAGTAETAAGKTVRARIRDGRLTINSSGVVASDLEASNGVIHVIDTVLIPG